MTPIGPFKPAWWLGNAHAQTIYPVLARRLTAPIDIRERFELPDGDFIDLSWAVNGLNSETPLVVLLHGLGGDVASPNVAGLLQSFNRRGWRGVFMHFRGASHESNRLPRAYHSGFTGDLDCLLQALAVREPHTKKAIVGVSLGGNVLLKWLGEQGSQSLVQAATAVSVPFDLQRVTERVKKGFSRVYQAYFLRCLRQIFERKREQHGDLLPPATKDMDLLRCFLAFDEQIIAPLYGYPNAHAYYREASSRKYLGNIKTPTLIIHALDDPMMTPEAIPQDGELSEAITFELSRKGGHVGFIEGNVPGKPIYWLDQRISAFLQAYL